MTFIIKAGWGQNFMKSNFLFCNCDLWGDRTLYDTIAFKLKGNQNF